MRKLLILSGVFFCLAGAANAQLSVSINIGTQPVWGPTGYDHVDNYYLPEVDAYYSVPTKQYTYMSGNRWITSPSLPPQYRNVDLYKTYKVVENGNKPWMKNYQHDRQQYAGYKTRHDQPVIRDAKDQKYYANPGHPQHNQWQKQQNQHGNQNGHDNGHH
jgi:hypothetical protein